MATLYNVANSFNATIIIIAVWAEIYHVIWSVYKVAYYCLFCYIMWTWLEPSMLVRKSVTKPLKGPSSTSYVPHVYKCYVKTPKNVPKMEVFLPIGPVMYCVLLGVTDTPQI